MPKIATYTPDQIQTGVTRGPRATALSLDTRRLEKGISDVAVAAGKIKNRMDTTAAEEALNGFEKAKNDILFNADTGYYNTQGRNAYDNAADTNKALEGLKKQFGDDLGIQSRQMFNNVVDKHLMRSSVDILKHSSKGLKAWEIATIESQVENTMENAGLYWNNPQDLKVQRVLGESAILEAAKLSGIGGEATNEKLQTYRSKFMSSAVNSATAISSVEGQKVFDDNDKFLEPQDKIKLQKTIATKKKEEDTKFNATQATMTATRLVSDYDSRHDIQTEVNKIKDLELRKKTMTESMTLYSQKRKAESEERGDIFEDVEGMIMKGGTAIQFQISNPAAWEKLSPKQQKKLAGDGSIETDWNVYSDLLTLPKNKLAEIDPTDYFDQLSKTERKGLISAVKTARGGGSKTEKNDTQVGRTRAAEVKAAVTQIFGPTKKQKGDDLAKIDGFYSMLDAEVNFREDQKGSKLTSAEFTDVLAGFTREITQEKSFWFDKTTTFEDISSEDVSSLSKILRTGNMPVSNEAMVRLNSGLSSANITNDDALQLSKYLKINGIPVTADNIVKAYEQVKGK